MSCAVFGLMYFISDGGKDGRREEGNVMRCALSEALPTI
jgi:hypothetical protein